MSESTIELINILPFIALCFLMIVGFSLYSFSYDKKIDRGVIKRNSLIGIIAVSLVSIIGYYINSLYAWPFVITIWNMAIAVNTTLLYCLLMCLLHNRTTMIVQLAIFIVLCGIFFIIPPLSWSLFGPSGEYLVLFEERNISIALAILLGSALYLYRHFKQFNNKVDSHSQETPGILYLCSTFIIITVSALLALFIDSKEGYMHDSFHFLIIMSSCFLTALVFSLSCDKKINFRLISNCLIVLSIVYLASINTSYSHVIQLVLFGLSTIIVVIIMRYIINKFNINDSLDIILITSSAILQLIIFLFVVQDDSKYNLNYNVLNPLFLAHMLIAFIAGALITMFTLLLIRIINPMLVNRFGIIRESKRDIEKRILLSKNALIILDAENCKASNLKKAFSLASNLSKIKSVKIAVPSHLLAPAETNALASDSKLPHDIIITDVDEINSAIESCDLQIIIGNHYRQLSMKTNNNNDQKNNRLMTDKAKTSIIISDKRKIRVHQSNQRSLILYYTGSITDFQGIIKHKSKDEMRDKVQRSSNIAEKFIVTIGFCITTVLTIITAFIYPEYTPHIALFGLLSLCTFYVSHNINSNMHTPFLNWITVPCSAIILFCLPLANNGPLEIIIISCALILFFLMNIVLSSALVINAKMLAMFNTKKQSRKLKPKKSKKLDR